MRGSENHITTMETPVPPGEAIARLERLSKSGKLAGFERGEGDDLASFTAYGSPFDGRVVLREKAGGLVFDLVMPRKGAIIIAVVLALSVWPGLPITDSFLYGFVWYERLMSKASWLDTWVWYLPLTVIPAPFAVLGAMKKSRAAATAHANETIERIRPMLAE